MSFQGLRLHCTLLFVQLFRKFVGNESSWTWVLFCSLTLKRVPTPLFCRFIRCSTHGRSFTRLWYICFLQVEIPVDYMHSSALHPTHIYITSSYLYLSPSLISRWVSSWSAVGLRVWSLRNTMWKSSATLESSCSSERGTRSSIWSSVYLPTWVEGWGRGERYAS